MNGLRFSKDHEWEKRPLPLLFTLIMGLGLVLGLWLSLTAVTDSAHAETLCVRPGGIDCYATISGALAAAQQNDTIRVAAGVYNENLYISQTITLEGGWSPDFTERDLEAFLSVILPADNTQSVVTIQGQFGDPAAVAPTLEGFIITGGRADLGSNHGGGLRLVDSNAALISNTIQNNTAFLLGGGVWVQRGAPLFQDNTIRDNLTVGLGQDAHGGGMQLENSQATLLDNILSGNVVSGTETHGGGLAIAGTGTGQVTIRRNQFISNTANTPGSPAANGFGGAVALSSGQILLADSSLISNTAATGGGIFLGGRVDDCCQFSGEGNLIQANVALRGGGMAIEGDAEDCCEFRSDNNIFRQNTADQGGGIFIGGDLTDCCNLTGHNNLFQLNTAVEGGGMAIEGDVEDCCQFSGDGNVFRQNSADRGGGLFIGGMAEDCCQFSGRNMQIQENSAGEGGGLHNDGQVARIRGGLFISNTAVADGGGVLIGAGGFISLTNSAAVANQAGQDGGGIHNSGFISVSNTTVSGNSAGGMGGGIANLQLVDLVNATVSGNTGADGAGFFNANMVNTVNSLIALNVGDNCLGAMNSLGHNLDDGFTCALDQPSDMPNTPPAIDPLANNGGTTPSHALAEDSPAIDAGDNSACAAVDQRGASRPVDGDGDGLAVCDIGAYEYGAVLPWLYLPLVLR